MIEWLDWNKLLSGITKLSVACLTFSIISSTGQVITTVSLGRPARGGASQMSLGRVPSQRCSALRSDSAARK